MALQHTDSTSRPDQFERALQVLDHDFGKSIKLSDIMYSNARKPAHQCHTMDLHLDKEGFYVVLDVHHFTPEEITMVIKDNNIVVEGKHVEKEDDHGYVSRHFVRRYELPKSVSVDGIISTLSLDGVLTVSAPRARCVGEERHIPILKTGIPILKSIVHPHHGK